MTQDTVDLTTPLPEAEGQRPTPSRVEYPSFLLCPPFSYSADTPNNVWMDELDVSKRRIDGRRAFTQFTELYRFLSSEALVHLLPVPADSSLQDLVFTANLGIVLEHLESRNTVILSNFTSEPRRGETEVGRKFFESMGYETYVSPSKFEGDAELKHLHDNVYVGGYGIRSELQAYQWMEDMFDMEIVPLAMTDEHLYHLDCTVFPITREATLVCTEMYEKDEVARLEKHTDVIDVSADDAYTGICNSVRLANTILNASHIHELKKGTDDYRYEVQKNRKLEDIAAELAFEVNYFNLSEYHKGGALLSCMVMHLNRYSYTFELT